jgi:RNA polymerase sigma-70 factor (ECF subfamily)
MAESQALFIAHQASLVRYLAAVVGHVETARDLVQDVFVRVLTAGDLPPTEDARRAWVFRIARNVAIDHHRRQQHRRVRPIEIESAPSKLDSADTVVIVRQALEALDDLSRDVFLMREAAGLSYIEIARVCQLTPDAVRSRIHRARLQLREYLERPIQTESRRRLRASFR